MGIIEENQPLLDFSKSVLKKYYPTEEDIRERLIPIVNGEDVKWDHYLRKGDDLIFGNTFKHPMIISNPNFKKR